MKIYVVLEEKKECGELISDIFPCGSLESAKIKLQERINYTNNSVNYFKGFIDSENEYSIEEGNDYIYIADLDAANTISIRIIEKELLN